MGYWLLLNGYFCELQHAIFIINFGLANTVHSWIKTDTYTNVDILHI